MHASIFVGTSLDGFIARKNGAFDFLPSDGGEPHGFNEFLASVDAIVMGRSTFDTVLPMNPWPYGQKPVFVLSSRSLPDNLPGVPVERLSGTPDDVVAHLSDRGFQRLYVDGGSTIQQFLRAGLIERLIITRVPVLIGTGISLFGELKQDIRLRHVATRQLKGGLVQSEYVRTG
jgi:dihydrofolate reductase